MHNAAGDGHSPVFGNAGILGLQHGAGQFPVKQEPVSKAGGFIEIPGEQGHTVAFEEGALSVSTPGIAMVCTRGIPSTAASELEIPPALESSTSDARI